MRPRWTAAAGRGVTRGRGPWSPVLPAIRTCVRSGRDFLPVNAPGSRACLGSRQAVSAMGRQIGPRTDYPQVVVLESRLNALGARVLAIEARLDRAERGTQRRPAPEAASDRGGITAVMEPILEKLTADESMRLIEQAPIGRIGFTSTAGPVVL